MQLPIKSRAKDRKWSDWSICTSDCVQTRIRLNCDDLRFQAPSSGPPAGSRETKSLNETASGPSHQKPSPESSRKTLKIKRHSIINANNKQAPLSKNQEPNNEETPPAADDESLLAAADEEPPTNDDEEADSDYPAPAMAGREAPAPPSAAPAPASSSEGDREDEEDPCFGLDPGMLTQRSSCTGGQCPRKRHENNNSQHGARLNPATRFTKLGQSRRQMPLEAGGPFNLEGELRIRQTGQWIQSTWARAGHSAFRKLGRISFYYRAINGIAIAIVVAASSPSNLDRAGGPNLELAHRPRSTIRIRFG